MGNITQIYSGNYTDASLVGGAGMTAIGNSMGIMVLLCIPAILLAAYWRTGSLLLGLAGCIGTWLVWAPLKPYGEIFPVLLLILLVATILKMAFDVFTSGLKI
jgi:hypothetical protein